LKIKLFVLDVDGTLTDGGVYLDGKGNELKRFDIQDGYGIVWLLRLGVKVVFLSGRYSSATQQRADELKISACINGTRNKIADLKRIASEFGVDRSEVAYAGDDIPDMECIQWSGLGMAVSNSVKEIAGAADWISQKCGGHGAIRECAEYIIKINEENK